MNDNDGRKRPKKEPGIYLEVKPAVIDEDFPGLRGGLLGYKHAYLVLRRPDGSTEVIRGGSRVDGWGRNFWDLTVETGRSMQHSADAYRPEEAADSRPSRRLSIPPENVEKAWTTMRQRAEAVRRKELGYDPLVPEMGDPERTSNSVVRSALQAAGVPLEEALPKGIGPERLPGIESDLKRELEAPEEPSPLRFDGGPSADAGAARARRTEALALQADIARADADDVERVLLKRPADLTEDEVLNLGRRRVGLPQGDPEAGRLFAAESAFYDDAYGTAPQPKDETGRPMPPVPRRPVPSTPKSLRTPEGEPLDAAIGRLAGRVGVAAERDGTAAAVRRLQRTLNDLPDRAEADDDGAGAPRPVVSDGLLKEDGVFGPKTRGRLTRALALHGVRPLDDGLRGRRPAVSAMSPPMRGHDGFRPV